MKITIDANWDDEAKVWVAIAREQVGLATEAQSLDQLRDGIALKLADLVEDESVSPEFDLVVHSAAHGPAPVAAE
ncbi:DUF1902 domain-containing protein [Chelativorans xinjiangense]|uniref:DUF1902 domain-containing protein n=1 Tax=Chelativorans xinjiangense TaxID=2681485 RepID=UPI001356D6C0|nr:DUF1902 domain-containing protein [Chelativorans xinjiangense]